MGLKHLAMVNTKKFKKDICKRPKKTDTIYDMFLNQSLAYRKHNGRLKVEYLNKTSITGNKQAICHDIIGSFERH